MILKHQRGPAKADSAWLTSASGRKKSAGHPLRLCSLGTRGAATAVKSTSREPRETLNANHFDLILSRIFRLVQGLIGCIYQYSALG